ncbi:MAG: 2-C-methyl-D-erythritol 2,4-cyclodiphosphate synthase [Phycisphaerae bacterium]|nr:2-C-methyl-D-erythritol 2,4-cyclodiphosphate synthase [Phycisphaerae bacterium]
MPASDSPATAPFRVGLGYDLHRIEPLPPNGHGRPFVLGGVQISEPGATTGPVGHSDADVLLHAVTDAILGALGLPDIGQLFPDTDPRHAGADSRVFLELAAARTRAAGWAVANLDAVVILERPKISPFKERIRASVASMLGIGAAQVNVKGKTHERVDAVGEGRAVEAHVVALLVRTSPEGSGPAGS